MRTIKYIKKFALINIAIVFMSIILIQPFTIKKASAVGNGYMNECGTSFLEEWDWQTAVKTVAPDFDINTSSYMIMQMNSGRDAWNATPINYASNFNKYYLVLAPTNGKLLISLGNWSQYTNVMLFSIDGPSQILRPIEIMSQPTGHGWTGANIVTTVTANSSWSNPWPYPFVSTHSVPTPTTYWACYSSQKNLEYAPSWQATYSEFTRFETSNDNTPEVPCATLDMACHIAKIYNKTIDTMKDAITTVIEFLANAFIPDMGIVNQDFEDIASAWNVQVGFLPSIIGYFPDIIDAMTSTVYDTTCTSSSCTRNFGNMFGQPFIVDFAKPANQVMPNIIAWFRGMLIFVTFTTIVIMFRRKYLTLLGHGSMTKGNE